MTSITHSAITQSSPTNGTSRSNLETSRCSREDARTFARHLRDKERALENSVEDAMPDATRASALASQFDQREPSAEAPLYTDATKVVSAYMPTGMLAPSMVGPNHAVPVSGAVQVIPGDVHGTGLLGATGAEFSDQIIRFENSGKTWDAQAMIVFRSTALAGTALHIRGTAQQMDIVLAPPAVAHVAAWLRDNQQDLAKILSRRLNRQIEVRIVSDANETQPIGSADTELP